MRVAVSCPDDLLIYERRGELTPAQERALAEHLAGCELCRSARAATRLVGPLPEVDAGDESLAKRLVVKAMAPTLVPTVKERFAPSPLRRRAPPRRSLALAAMLVLTTSAASAAWWHFSSARREASAIAARAAADPRLPRAKRRHRVGSLPTEVEPPSPLPAAPDLEAAVPGAPDGRIVALASPAAVAAGPRVEAPSTGGKTSESPSTVTPPCVMPAERPGAAALSRTTRSVAARPIVGAGPGVDATAADLFVAANGARRIHRVDEALRLYRRLQATFPGSAEAGLSHLSVGELCMSQRRWDEALSQFDAYLRSDDAVLGEEALVGRARALERLGRTRAEREAWEALLARYPQSDYGWRAQQRLADLAANAR